MGQDVESYFQEVMATVEQSVEEGSRGEGGALRGRLQQLYGEIVGDSDAGTRRRGGKSCKRRAQYERTNGELESKYGIGKGGHQDSEN